MLYIVRKRKAYSLCFAMLLCFASLHVTLNTSLRIYSSQVENKNKTQEDLCSTQFKL